MGLIPRKKSGNVFAGSRLNVPGQGIYNVKKIKSDPIGVKGLIDNPKRRSTPTPNPSKTPTPTPTNTQIPTPTPTPTPTNTQIPTPTTTPTPTLTPTNTQTPTLTPTPTVTPTTPPCNCYQFVLTSINISCLLNSPVFQYVDCNGVTQTEPIVSTPFVRYICTKDVNSVTIITSPSPGQCNGNVTFYTSDCINCFPPTPTPTPTISVTPSSTPTSPTGFLDVNVAVQSTLSPFSGTVWYAISNSFNPSQPFPVGFTWTQLGSVQLITQCNNFVNFGQIAVFPPQYVYIQVRDDLGNVLYQNRGYDSLSPNPCTFPFFSSYTKLYNLNSSGNYNYYIRINDPITTTPAPPIPSPTPTNTPTLTPTPTNGVVMELSNCCDGTIEYAIIPPSIPIGRFVKLNVGISTNCYEIITTSSNPTTANYVSGNHTDCMDCFGGSSPC